MATPTAATPGMLRERQKGGAALHRAEEAAHRAKLLVILAVWLVLYFLLKGNDTRALGLQDTTGFHDWLNGIRDWVQLHGPETGSSAACSATSARGQHPVAAPPS